VTSLLALKLFLAPIFVALVSFIQRRWGDRIGGLLIGLPLTTGPFIFIIYLQEGSAFAARAAHGVLVGQVALMVFAWTYAITALKLNWYQALSTGTIACIATGAVLTSFEIPLIFLLPSLLITWYLVTKFWPQYSKQNRHISPPRWELPARIAVTLIVILSLTGLASLLGARVSGALSTYPVIASVLGAFNQRRSGADATVATLKGIMQSLPFTIVLMATLAILL